MSGEPTPNISFPSATETSPSPPNSVDFQFLRVFPSKRAVNGGALALAGGAGFSSQVVSLRRASSGAGSGLEVASSPTRSGTAGGVVGSAGVVEEAAGAGEVADAPNEGDWSLAGVVGAGFISPAGADWSVNPTSGAVEDGLDNVDVEAESTVVVDSMLAAFPEGKGAMG